MKINLVLYSFPKPSETFLVSLAVELIRRQHDVKIIVLTAANIYSNIQHHKLSYNEIKGRVIPSPLENRIATLLFLVKRLGGFVKYFVLSERSTLRKKVLNFVRLSLINSNRPDIIHFAYSGIAIEFIDILDLIDNGTKKFVSCRGSAEIYKPIVDSDRENLLRLLWPKVDFVHCVSQDMMNRMEAYGLGKPQAFVNFPSIDLKKFKYLQRNQSHCESILDSVIIISTGRLDHQKGYLYALLAIKKLIAKGVKLEYHILGEGPEFGPIKFFIDDQKLDNNVFLHGKVNADSVSTLLAKAHIFLLPSVYEGISNAALEAMASGVPIVTTDGGGMSEVVKNRINGLIVPRCDPGAIVEAVEYTIDNYQEAIKLAQNARETIQVYFNLKNQIDSFEHKYQLAITHND